MQFCCNESGKVGVVMTFNDTSINGLTICMLMDFPIHIDTISMGLPILYLKGSQK